MVSTPGRGLSGSLPKLHVIGADAELGLLILAGRRGAKRGGYVLAVDESLIEQINAAQDAEAPALPLRSVVESGLTPREIQVRLRTGRTVEQVAAEAGVDPEWVDRFAAPVRAEQAAAVERAGRSVLNTPRKGSSERPLETSVLRNLADRGVVMLEEEWQQAWSARQLVDGNWLVSLTFRNRGRTMLAEWVLDASNGGLTSRNRLGTELGYVDAGHRALASGVVVVQAGSPASAPAPVRRAAKARGARKSAAAKTSAGRASVRKTSVGKTAGRKAAARKAAGRTALGRKAAGRTRPAAAVRVVAVADRAGVKKASGRKSAGRAKSPGLATKATRTTKRTAGSSKAVAVGRKSAPVRKAALPARKAALPARKAALPVKKAALPVKKAALPVKKAALPVRKAALPVRKAAVSAKKAAVRGTKKAPARATRVASRAPTAATPTAAVTPRAVGRSRKSAASAEKAPAPPAKSDGRSSIRQGAPAAPVKRRARRSAVIAPPRAVAAPAAERPRPIPPSATPARPTGNPGESTRWPTPTPAPAPAPRFATPNVTGPPAAAPEVPSAPKATAHFNVERVAPVGPATPAEPVEPAPVSRRLVEADATSRPGLDHDGANGLGPGVTIPISSAIARPARRLDRPLRAIRLGAGSPRPDS